MGSFVSFAAWSANGCLHERMILPRTGVDLHLGMALFGLANGRAEIAVFYSFNPFQFFDNSDHYSPSLFAAALIFLSVLYWLSEYTAHIAAGIQPMSVNCKSRQKKP